MSPVKALFTKLFTAIKASKPDAIVSLAPNPYSYSYNYFLQDWRTWERRGLIEELMLQVYDDPLNTFKSALLLPEVQTAQRHIPTGVGILTGLRDHPVTMQQVQQRVQFVRDRHFSGVSFFFYETLWNLTPEQPRDRLTALRILFPSFVDRPERKRL